MFGDSKITGEKRSEKRSEETRRKGGKKLVRINTLDVIKDYEGKDMLDDKTPLTYRAVFNLALNAQLKDDVIPAEQKSKIFQLTLKIFKDKEVDLTVDERTLIKEKVGKFYNPLVFGRVSEALEGNENIKTN